MTPPSVPGPVRIRPATPADGAALFALRGRSCAGIVFDPDFECWSWDVLHRPGSGTLLAEDAVGRVVAFATFTHDGAVVECGMDADAPARDDALARLMGEVESRLRRAGAASVRVRLDPGDPVALALSALGYASRVVTAPQWRPVGGDASAAARIRDCWDPGWSVRLSDYR